MRRKPPGFLGLARAFFRVWLSDQRFQAQSANSPDDGLTDVDGQNGKEVEVLGGFRPDFGHETHCFPRGKLVIQKGPRNVELSLVRTVECHVKCRDGKDGSHNIITAQSHLRDGNLPKLAKQQIVRESCVRGDGIIVQQLQVHNVQVGRQQFIIQVGSRSSKTLDSFDIDEITLDCMFDAVPARRPLFIALFTRVSATHDACHDGYVGSIRNDRPVRATQVFVLLALIFLLLQVPQPVLDFG